MKARFLLSRSKVLAQYKAVRELCDSVSYSVKTNPEVTEILEKNTDSMFSVHFATYMDAVKDKKKMWFLAQSWKSEDIDVLSRKGVESFIVDNENDLNVLLKWLEKKDAKINLLLRMRMKERTIHTERHFVFGFFSSQINAFIPELRKNHRIGKLGIHFHRKTQNISEWELKKELEENLSKETLSSIDAVNIGGGLPVEYKNHAIATLPYIFSKIRELREWLNSQNIKLIIEPGRFIAAPSIKLEAEIINVYNGNVIINCSVYNSAMDTFVAHIRLLIDGEKASGTPYTVKGYLPDSMDVFRYRVYLDAPKAGDKLIFLNAGAYTYRADLCNVEKLETIVVE
ncbi:MAG: decarboxylase [Candidatus Aenigmarchaeota archaeon]|nr:decarboxylase [Candidatus Aenigmarchaeota archaeon]